MVLTPLVAPRAGNEATEGNFLHWLSHSKLKAECAAIGDIGPQPPMPPSVAFSAWIAEYYVRHVRETVPPNWSLECECALAYQWEQFILSGHIDNVALSPDATEAIGFDLKTGYDPVDMADENMQVMGYAALLLRAYPTLHRITFWIVQPRNDEDMGYQRCSSVVIEGGVLESVPTSLENQINATIANNMTVDSGPKQCKWCSGALQCPAAIAERDLMKQQLTPELLAAIRQTPDDEALLKWYVAGRTIARPLDDATDMLKERIKTVGVPGTAIKTEGGAYSFPDPVAFDAKARAMIPAEKYAACVKPSVTAIKDAIAEVRGVPKSSKNGESAASIWNGEFASLVVQGTRERIVLV